MIRLDFVRQVERELVEAFARGAFDQPLREWDAALARAREGFGYWAQRLLVPGPDQVAFCGKFARDWAALPAEQREPDVVAWVVRELGGYGGKHPTPVIPLRRAAPISLGKFVGAYLDRLLSRQG